MEVMIPNNSHDLDFDFNSARSSPHATAPSTPKSFFGNYYFSAPTSPSHISQFYRDFDAFLADSGGGSCGSAVVGGGAASGVPFRWEEKPGTPKSPPVLVINDDNDTDFAFDVSKEWETASLPPADELFDGGVIKPLKPPPRPALHPASARITEADNSAPVAKLQRGRERGLLKPAKSSSRRAARSFSPIRDQTQFYQWQEEEENKERTLNPKESSSAATVCSALSAASVKVQRKWRLKDFFLFRSASEGRAAEKDPLKRYTAAVRNSSFRAIESPGWRRRGQVSAHELHYTMNRAVSEDLKRKTFLPYKQGILGRLAFNPAVHALANGFGFSRK